MMRKVNITILTMLAALWAVVASARNVDLSTVPDRESVQLTIYNSADLTLVRETRRVTFTKGDNSLQFSWANTLIDPTSVELQFLSQKDALSVSSTTYPHDKGRMLDWTVQSEMSGEAMVQISYFTSGLSWAADYTAIADADEKTMHMEGFVRVFNQSGEDYENAQIRLVVGNVNLVEQIALLARLSDEQDARRLHRFAFERQLLADEHRRDGIEAKLPYNTLVNYPTDWVELSTKRLGRDITKEIEIEKVSFSEYFLYTIEGEQTVPNGWSKRIRSFEGKDVPFDVVYRFRAREYGDQLVRMFVLTNEKDSKLGTTPLPDGTVRVLRRNQRDGLSFLASQDIRYVPIGDKIELNLGVDRNVVFDLIKTSVWRDNIWLRVQGVDVLRRVEGGLQVEDNSPVVGFDEHTYYVQRVRNFTDKAIEVEVRRAFEGDATFRSELKPEQIDFQTVEYPATLQLGEKQEQPFELIVRRGTSEKQSRLEIENARARIKP